MWDSDNIGCETQTTLGLRLMQHRIRNGDNIARPRQHLVRDTHNIGYEPQRKLGVRHRQHWGPRQTEQWNKAHITSILPIIGVKHSLFEKINLFYDWICIQYLSLIFKQHINYRYVRMLYKLLFSRGLYLYEDYNFMWK